MSTLGTLRGDIADIVGEATTITAFPYLPARITPPCAVVLPGSPYLEDGDVYKSYNARFTIDLVMGTAANEVTSAGLDDQVETTIMALTENGYSLESVQAPYAMEMNNATYLATTITISTNYRP